MATATALSKLDLYKAHAAEYATPRKPVLLDVKSAKYLAVSGTGAPGGEEFQRCIGALYGTAYTIKMMEKFAGHHDYSVCKLEAQYWAGECGADFAATPPAEWRWKIMIRTPDFITARHLKQAVASLRAKGKEGDFEAVQLESIHEGKCVQVLHVGPYEREPESIEKMRTAAAEAGYEFLGPHREIYLSDPRRVAPEKLKTILRIPVEKVS